MTISRKQFLKNAGFTLAGLSFPYSKLFANVVFDPLTGDTKHPKDCTNNLRDNFLFPSSKIRQDYFDYYKGAPPGVIKDVFYKDELGIVACSTASTDFCDQFNHHEPNNKNTLRYKVYYPVSATIEEGGHDYVSTPLPIVVFFHAGGYMECTNFELHLMDVLCTNFARKGYISVTVEYRTGILKDDDSPEKTTVQQQLAPYRAQQDGRGVIRSIMQRQFDNGHDGLFTFNKDQFFIGGTSAGAIVALGVAYFRTQVMMDQAFPKAATSLSLKDALGSFNPDYYYGSLDTENIPIIRGVLCCWGGIQIPIAYDGNGTGDVSDEGTVESTFFAGGNQYSNPPMIAFHGFADQTIPYPDKLKQDLLFSTTPKYKNENFCLVDMTGSSYILKNPAKASTKLCSSLNMYNILKNLNRFTELYIDCNGGHGLDGDDSLATTDWGTGIANDDLVALYIVQRGAVFFQTIMNVLITNPPPPFGYKGRSIFRDCVNNRICTDPGENNTCTSSNDIECTL